MNNSKNLYYVFTFMKIYIETDQRMILQFQVVSVQIPTSSLPHIKSTRQGESLINVGVYFT